MNKLRNGIDQHTLTAPDRSVRYLTIQAGHSYHKGYLALISEGDRL